MLPIKVQQQKTVKPSGQCLTLVSVCLHLLVLVLPPPLPSFWAQSLHVGIHSAALTGLQGMSWAICGTWVGLGWGLKSQRRRRETLTAEGCSPAFSLLPPRLRSWWVWDFFLLSVLLLRALTCFVNINLYVWKQSRKVVSLAWAEPCCAGERTGVLSCVSVCACECLFGQKWDVIHHAVVRRTQQA